MILCLSFERGMVDARPWDAPCLADRDIDIVHMEKLKANECAPRRVIPISGNPLSETKQRRLCRVQVILTGALVVNSYSSSNATSSPNVFECAGTDLAYNGANCLSQMTI